METVLDTHPGFNIYETFHKVKALIGPLLVSEPFIKSLSDLKEFEGVHPTFDGIKTLVAELVADQPSTSLDKELAEQLQAEATLLDKQYEEDERIARALQEEERRLLPK